MDKCSECGCEDLVEIRNEGCVCCASCGLVYDKLIYDENETCYSENDNMNSRLGAPINPLLAHSSFSTLITYSYKFRGLKLMHDRMSMNYVERALYHAFNYITRIMEDKLNLPKATIEAAKVMYKDLKEKRISRGQMHKALMAACVYFACKVHGNKLTKGEIAGVFEITTTKLNKACKIFRDLTKDKPYFVSMFDEIHISEIIVRMTDKMTWKNNVDRWNVIKVVRAMDNLVQHYGNLDNKHINSVLAALIYVATCELDIKVSSPATNKSSKVTKSMICDLYDLTLITLNKTIKEVQNMVAQHAQLCNLTF
jgi:transcription initiation factor TFIIIB Brf1 subunit/transcription initiation factor TFIIB